MKKPNAFTLVELIVVIAIIGVLTTIGASSRFRLDAEKATQLSCQTHCAMSSSVLYEMKNLHFPNQTASPI